MKRGKGGRKNAEKERRRKRHKPKGMDDRDVLGHSQFSRQCTRQPARRVYALRTVYSASCTAESAEWRGGTRDNEKCTRPRYTTCASKLQLQSRLSISLFLFPSLSLSLPPLHPSFSSPLSFSFSPTWCLSLITSSSNSCDARRGNIEQAAQ